MRKESGQRSLIEGIGMGAVALILGASSLFAAEGQAPMKDNVAINSSPTHSVQ